MAAAVPAGAQQTITLVGASQFNDDHAFNRTMLKFEELVTKYYGKPVNFKLHRNSELGLEKDYLAYMSQGLSVDYAVVAPSHMSTFSKAAPIMDMPFFFRDLTHWNKVLDGDALEDLQHLGDRGHGEVEDEVLDTGGHVGGRRRRRGSRARPRDSPPSPAPSRCTRGSGTESRARSSPR